MAEKRKWTREGIIDLSGKVVVVTGANSGIGFETTRALAGAGADVVLACRNLDKGRDALAQIQTEEPPGATSLLGLDLADLSSVHRFAERFLERYQRLDILVNNAGVMAIPKRMETADGFEMHFGTNHLGHFALTGLLIDRIKETAGSRVINVSSVAEMIGRINFDDLNARESYNRWLAYGQSKIANLLFTYELQRRFKASGIDAISSATHPGWTATNLQAHSAILHAINPIIGQGSETGALPTLYAATADDVVGGDYYGPGGLFQARGYPKLVRSNGRSHDREVAIRLWEVSEQLTGVRFLSHSKHGRT
jgi:NAD(P)-dependent dehydrogenase (short-subunit alcohol dehydrogenase family)